MMTVPGVILSKVRAPGSALVAAPASNRAKRALDLSAGAMMLLFLMPLLIAVALLIVLDSRGPVIFSQRRSGMGGRIFRIYKFRTMKVSEDGSSVRQAERGDRRVTRVGRFLRKSSIDELPQLMNVLRGEMSLVGPRPHALAHDEQYAALVPGYLDRFQTRPGITGLAQVNGFRGEITSSEALARRIDYDLHYIETWSLRQDLNLLWRTLSVGAFHPAAY